MEPLLFAVVICATWLVRRYLRSAAAASPVYEMFTPIFAFTITHGPRYPAIWVMQQCMSYGIHAIAPYDGTKTVKWNDVINDFHRVWGPLYPGESLCASE